MTDEKIIEMFKNYETLSGTEFAPINDLIVKEKSDKNNSPLICLYLDNYNHAKEAFKNNWFGDDGFGGYYECFCYSKDKDIELYPKQPNFNLISEAYNTYIQHLNFTIDVMEFWGLSRINEYVSLDNLYNYSKSARKELVEFMESHYNTFEL